MYTHRQSACAYRTITENIHSYKLHVFHMKDSKFIWSTRPFHTKSESIKYYQTMSDAIFILSFWRKNWRQKIKSINIRTLCEIFHRDALFHFKILLSMTVEHVEFSKTPSSSANWVTDRVDRGWTPLSPPPMPQALPLPAMVRYVGFLENYHIVCLCKVQLPCSGMQWHMLHVFRWWGMCKLRLCALGLQRRTTISTSPKMMWSQFWSSRRTGGWENSVGLRGGSPKPMLQCWAAVMHKQSKYTHAVVVVMLLLSFLPW